MFNSGAHKLRKTFDTARLNIREAADSACESIQKLKVQMQKDPELKTAVSQGCAYAGSFAAVIVVTGLISLNAFGFDGDPNQGAITGIPVEAPDPLKQ